MHEYLQALANTQMFGGVAQDEIAAMLSCLNAVLRSYKKGEFVFRRGAYIRDVTLLVRGALHVTREDFWGNDNIISTIDAGEMFAEAYLAPDGGAMLNNVVAVEDSAVLFFDARRVLTACGRSCRFHQAVIRNLFYAVCDKNRKLVQKLGHMSKRTTREKLMSYLSEESSRQNRSTFVIPFNRQQLADFLSVDRSAMSSELGKMRDEGLIRFERSRFTLI